MEDNKKGFGAKKLLYYLTYTVFMTCFCLLLCEGVVRTYSWLFLAKMIRYDEALGWYHSENSQRYYESKDTKGEKGLTLHNKLGHRGPDYGPQPANGKKRVLILGDSFAEGAPVAEEELFSGIIANKYTNLEVMNAGVRGWGSVQEYLYLQKTGITFNPDLVLLLFYQNDPFDNCLSFHPYLGPRPFATMQNGQLVIHEELSPEGWRKYILPLPFADKLHRYSLAYNFFNDRLYQASRTSHIDRMALEDDQKTPEQIKIEVTNKIYQKMYENLKERGIKFAVGFIPSTEDAKKGSSDIQVPFLAFCKEKGIPCLSLVPSLKESFDKGKPPYYNNDIHWNKAGHQVAAEVLGPYIQELFTKN